MLQILIKKKKKKLLKRDYTPDIALSLLDKETGLEHRSPLIN